MTSFVNYEYSVVYKINHVTTFTTAISTPVLQPSVLPLLQPPVQPLLQPSERLLVLPSELPPQGTTTGMCCF